MRDRDFQRVVERIEASGHQSAYLDRLRGRVDAQRAQASLEAEIVQEMTEALGRSEDKLLLALVQLEVAEREARALLARLPPSDPQVRAAIEAHDQQREVALRRRLDLVIHREAIGLRRNDGIEQLYPIGRRMGEPR